MIPDELMKRRGTAAVIDDMVAEQMRLEAMQQQSAEMVGREFPLVMWGGTGRIVAADDGGVALLIRGMRADYTWERLARTWRRLRDDQVLGIDELGGAHDAVGIVSLFAFLEPDSVDVLDEQGLLRFRHTRKRRENPIHQFADMSTPTAWPQWRSHIHGD
jgi:hypothetical protein